MIVSVPDKYEYRHLIEKWMLRGALIRKDDKYRGAYQINNDSASTIEKMLKWQSWGFKIMSHSIRILIPVASLDLEVTEGVSFRKYWDYTDEENPVEVIRTWKDLLLNNESSKDGSKWIGALNPVGGTMEDIALIVHDQNVQLMTPFQYRLETNSSEWRDFDDEFPYVPTLTPELMDARWDDYFDDILQARQEMRDMHSEGYEIDPTLALKWEIVAPTAENFQLSVILREQIEAIHKPEARRRRIQLMKTVTMSYLPMSDIERIMPYFSEVANSYLVTGAIGTEYINYHTQTHDPEGILDFANGTASYDPVDGSKPSVRTLMVDAPEQVKDAVVKAYQDIILTGTL